MKIRVIRLSIFRESESDWEFNFDKPIRIQDIRIALHNELKQNQDQQLLSVLARSAFAREGNILVDDDLLIEDTELSVLPPVGGG